MYVHIGLLHLRLLTSSDYELPEDTIKSQDQSERGNCGDLLRYELPPHVRQKLALEIERELDPVEDSLRRHLPYIVQVVHRRLLAIVSEGRSIDPKPNSTEIFPIEPLTDDHFAGFFDVPDTSGLEFSQMWSDFMSAGFDSHVNERSKVTGRHDQVLDAGPHGILFPDTQCGDRVPSSADLVDV